MKSIIQFISGLSGSAFGGEAMLAIILAAAFFGAGYLKGAASERADIAQEKLDLALAHAGEIAEQQSRADSLANENGRQRAAQAPKDRIVTQEITRYVQVTRPADRCTLPGTWRLRHDAAATGTPVAEAGPVAAGTADPVEDAAALETIGINYEACRNDQAKLAAWQRRYQALETAE